MPKSITARFGLFLGRDAPGAPPIPMDKIMGLPSVVKELQDMQAAKKARIAINTNAPPPADAADPKIIDPVAVKDDAFAGQEKSDSVGVEDGDSVDVEDCDSVGVEDGDSVGAEEIDFFGADELDSIFLNDATFAGLKDAAFAGLAEIDSLDAEESDSFGVEEIDAIFLKDAAFAGLNDPAFAGLEEKDSAGTEVGDPTGLTADENAVAGENSEASSSEDEAPPLSGGVAGGEEKKACHLYQLSFEQRERALDAFRANAIRRELGIDNPVMPEGMQGVDGGPDGQLSDFVDFHWDLSSRPVDSPAELRRRLRGRQRARNMRDDLVDHKDISVFEGRFLYPHLNLNSATTPDGVVFECPNDYIEAKRLVTIYNQNLRRERAALMPNAEEDKSRGHSLMNGACDSVDPAYVGEISSFFREERLRRRNRHAANAEQEGSGDDADSADSLVDLFF